MSELGPLSADLRDTQARFSALVENARPDLHRYCTRMTGSALDGEDVLQESLAQAFYGLSLLREDVPLRPWLFKIAHHKCVDFLRARRTWAVQDVDELREPMMEIDAEIEDRELASRAFSRLVLVLPPRERASVVLKDVLGYSLPEIAKILEVSVGGVKAALHRGREKLADVHEPPERRAERLPTAAQLYIDAFNRRDWAALGSLLEEDVQCELVGHALHIGREALEHNYFANYSKCPFAVRLCEALVDGQPELVCLREDGGQWKPWNFVRIEWHAGRVKRIRDYVHVPYLVQAAPVILDPGSRDFKAAK